MATLWVGVDVAKAMLDVAVVAEERVFDLGQFSNEAAGLCHLASRIQSEISQSEQATIHLVLEPTGGYEQHVVSLAYQHGWQVSLPNPKQVREWARGVGQRAKTDRQDAQLLARYGAAIQPPHQPALASEVSQLDGLLKRRGDLEQMRQQERNRLQEVQGRPDAVPAVCESLEQMLEHLDEALQAVDQTIEALLAQHTRLRQQRTRLLALPGVGPKVVLPLLVLLQRWHTLTGGTGSAKALTAFVGLDPRPYRSGSSVFKRPTISKMGNKEMRRLLYMGALSAVHAQNPLHDFYQRLVGRGKARKLAVVAAARKLLVWAWTLFSRQMDWDPTLHAA